MHISQTGNYIYLMHNEMKQFLSRCFLLCSDIDRNEKSLAHYELALRSCLSNELSSSGEDLLDHPRI